MSPSEPLRQFLQAARSAGIRVSAAEGIDAARAVQVVGLSDRTVLKDSLSLVLAKTPDEKNLFDECFDLYFKRDGFAQEDEDATSEIPNQTAQGGFGAEGMGGSGGASLSQTLLEHGLRCRHPDYQSCPRFQDMVLARLDGVDLAEALDHG